MNVLGPGFAATVIIGFVVALVVAVLVGGVLLRLAVRWVARFTPGYGRCCVAVLAALVFGVLLNLIVVGVVRYAAVAGGALPGLAWQLMGGVLGLALAVVGTAGAVEGVIRRPDGQLLGFPRALAVAAVFDALCLALYGVVVVGAVLVLGGVPGVSR
jgi:hypothetical protein